VDDNAASCQALLQLLQELKMEADSASSGQQALQLLRNAAAQGQDYDLVLIDLHMPVIDGLTLIERIKSNTVCRTVRTVLMIGRQDRGLAERGETEFLLKPVRRNRLRELLSGHHKRPVPTPEKLSLLANVAGHILVVDDNIINQRLVTRLLEQRGFSVDVVENGLEAVEATALNTYNLILMDCQMPVMNGFDATAEIRRRLGHASSLPIISMTADLSESDKQRCQAVGMNDHLPKPITTTVLWSLIDKWIPAVSTAKAGN
jgi:two-component system, sensor histidine kinase and response regulator